VLGKRSFGTRLTLLNLGHFFFEGHELRRSIENVHREILVVAKPFPGDKTSHHPLELREAIINLSDADLTS
jgi:hypothetical protein